jgi:hypothetical protein
MTRTTLPWLAALLGFAAMTAGPLLGQSIDKNLAPNTADAGIHKTLAQQVGAGRGNDLTPDSSAFVIARDPFRSIRRGRQIFQRKFTREQGQGPLESDGAGDINRNLAIGAGLADSCAACHGRPRGSAGSGGNVATRPDSRDAPHLFGLGLKEMLADEITADLRAVRDGAIRDARRLGHSVTRSLDSKGIHFGSVTAFASGAVSTSNVRGVSPDLRVRPFFLHGETTSIRECIVAEWKAQMGLDAVDPDLAAAAAGRRIVTPGGMVLDGSHEAIEAPPTADASADPDGDGVASEIPQSLVDFMEFYLLHDFRAGRGEQNATTHAGRSIFLEIGCGSCHIPDLTLDRDRRVIDVETAFDPARGNPFSRLFATATPSFTAVDDGSGHPSLKRPNFGRFVVRNIFTGFKRHDLGPNFHEINYDGTVRREFLTTPLWGVAATAPYGHDGRSIDLTEVILRHGGEAQRARNNFAALQRSRRRAVLEFLGSLVLFAPDDTASNLDPGDRSTPGYPQFGHGSINLTALFNNPADIE